MVRFAIIGKFRIIYLYDFLGTATKKLAGYASLGEDAPPDDDDGKKP
jgi:hypothetical protein